MILEHFKVPAKDQVIVSEAALRRTVTQIFEQFKDTMDTMLKTLRTATPAPGQDRVLYPGLWEAEEVVSRRAHGIPLHKEVLQWFAECTSELGLEPLAPMS